MQPVHYLVVTATDGGATATLSATTTVTVLVQDTADEVPVFQRETYEAEVPENVRGYIVTTVRVSQSTIGGQRGHIAVVVYWYNTHVGIVRVRYLLSISR